MVLFDGFAGLLFLALWIFCIIDVITTPPERCRNLPKMIWLVLVIVLADIGSIAWLVAGHTWDGKTGQRSMPMATRSRPMTMPTARARRPAAKPTNPDDDEEFLASLRNQAEEQGRRAREAPRPADEDPDSPST